MTDLSELKRLAEAATKGPWHHCLAFQTIPAQRTVHGPVPAARVDYVSTWDGPGTPPGHRVVIPQPDRECRVCSEDMAFIAALNPATALALIARVEEMERYAALGRSCEQHGLGWYIEDGTMRFQPPGDVIEEYALEHKNDRALKAGALLEEATKGLELAAERFEKLAQGCAAMSETGGLDPKSLAVTGLTAVRFAVELRQTLAAIEKGGENG